MLVGSLLANAERLQWLIGSWNADRVPFEAHLETHTWEAVKRPVMEHLHNPALQNELAQHWDRLISLAPLIEQYREYAHGMTSALGIAPEMRAKLRPYLIENAERLLQHAVWLAHELQQVHNGIPLDSAARPLPNESAAGDRGPAIFSPLE